MIHSVEKIGGTSISDTATVLTNVLIAGRKGEALYNRIFVVSAYAGITDQLLEHKQTGQPGVYALFASAESRCAWVEAIAEVYRAMCRINMVVFPEGVERRAADAFVRERITGVKDCLLDLHRLCSYGHFSLDEHLNTVREILAAQGEAHSAYNTALLLKLHGVNAAFVDLTGWRDESEMSIDERIRGALSKVDTATEVPIATGYVRCPGGLVHQYGRGYTEFTFSRVAVVTSAREAIIHKEFHLSTADPKLVGVEAVRSIGRTNYDVADQLSNLGMEAIHPCAAKELRRADIPLRIRSTFDPMDDGTVISSDYVSKEPRTEIVTGLKGVYALEFFEPDMVGLNSYDVQILMVLEKFNARIVTKASNANTITHYLDTAPKQAAFVADKLQEMFGTAKITTRKVSVVSAIGSDLKLQGLTTTAVGALSAARIEVLGVHQLMRNVDIIFIIDESRYEDAIRALHKALIEDAAVGIPLPHANGPRRNGRGLERDEIGRRREASPYPDQSLVIQQPHKML